MNRLLIAMAALFAFLLVGCGGSGGSGSGSSGGNAAIFITDDLTTGYDHVWVTIKSISVGKVGGGSTVVFSDPDGVTVDLRSLRDKDGRKFRFLAFAENLAGQYDSVTVVLDDDVILYPTGSSTGLARTFEGSVNGEKILTDTFDARTFGKGSDDDLIIDFDLSKWNDNGTQVTNAVIVVIDDDPDFNDDSRHERRSYPGRITNLQGTAPNQTFTLRRGNHEIDVQLNADTSVERAEDGSSSSLQNGMHVVVKGFFDTDVNMLIASRVKITGDEDDDDDDDEAYGTAINIDAVAGSFDMNVTSAEGFIPVSNPIHVTSNASTVYRSESGNFVTRDEFFAMVTATTVLEVEGVYDPATNTLLAAKIKIEDDNDEEDEAEIEGPTSSVNVLDGTFVVTVESFSGINVNPGDTITVVVDGDTVFRGLGGTGVISQAQFFAALTGTPGHDVEVEGEWDGSVLHADKAKLED